MLPSTMEAPQKWALIDQAVSEKKMFEHCYIYSMVSLSQWCAVPEIKYKEEREEKLICINLDVSSPLDKKHSRWVIKTNQGHAKHIPLDQ